MNNQKNQKTNKSNFYNSISSFTVRGKNRTYFLDLRKAKNNSLFFNLVESQLVNGSFKRNQIVIFEDNLSNFSKQFNALMEYYINYSSE